MKKIDLTGQKFGRLTVLSEVERNTGRHVMWICECECGTRTVASGDHLKSGNTKSCGCLMKGINCTHGMVGTPTYETWKSMRSRCNCLKSKSYKDYGARGIAVCRRWDKFKNFYADMGKRPEGLTIERIANNKGYSPDNCKWISRKENNRNKRSNITIRYAGKSQCITAWGEELGISKGTLYQRLKNHPPQIAFNMG